MRGRGPSLRNFYLAIVASAIAASQAGCQTTHSKLAMPAQDHDAALAPYFQEFLQAGRDRGVTIASGTLARLRVVTFVDDIVAKKADYGQPVDQSEDLVGTCTDAEIDDSVGAGKVRWVTGKNKWNEVWIASAMRAVSADQKMALTELMFHELGHCLLGRNHDETAGHHIMSPSLGNDEAWVRMHWEASVDELFGATKLEARN